LREVCFLIKGNVNAIAEAIDLSQIGISFSTKPIIHGGAAMEYYGLRKRGADIDFIITGEDYDKLVKLYPDNKKDIWGDLGIVAGQYELFRSIYRFDYHFFAADAHEYSEFKVISFEKLFFLKPCRLKIRLI
jgi:hypothetical protein